MYRDLAHCTVAYLEGFLPVREGSGAAETAVTMLSQGMLDANKGLRQTVEQALGRRVCRRDVLRGTESARRLENELRWLISEDPRLGRRIRSTVRLNGVFSLVLGDGRLYDPDLLAASERPASLNKAPAPTSAQPAARTR